MGDSLSSSTLTEEPIIIKYDGIDTERHEIELSALADSIKGLSRIISVAANFAATEKFVQHKDAMQVRVMAAPPKSGSFEIPLIIAWVSQNALATTVVGGLIVTLVSYIFSRLSRNKTEMKELRGALETAIKELGNRDQSVVDRLLDTIDKMSDGLKPAAKQAVAPIGNTASTLTVTSASSFARPVVIGAAEKDAIEASDPPEIIDEAEYHVRLHEVNKDNSSCKISLVDEPDVRIVAVITDPVFALPNNVFVLAFASDAPITVRAKAAVKDGAIEKLYISNSVTK